MSEADMNQEFPLQYLWQKLHVTEIPSTVLPCLISIIILFLSLCLIKHHFNNRAGKNARLPPSPSALPIIGNLHQLGKLPHRSLQALCSKCGPVMLMRLGQVPTLVISSADAAREMMKTHDVVFSNRSKPRAVDLLLNGYVDVAFAPYGEYWRQTKKICVIELLSQARVQSFQYVRKEEIDILVNKIRNCCKDGASIDLSDMLLAVTNNIMARCVLGRKCEGGDSQLGFAELSKRVSEQFVWFSFKDWFPALAWMDVLTGFVAKLKETYRGMDNYFNMVMEEHSKSYNRSDGRVAVDNKKEDFVDILLRVQKEKEGDPDFNVTINDIKAILVDMIVGGTDTTTTTMDWVMAELMKRPSAMKKAQEEVRRIVGSNKSEIDVEDIHQMDYLRCVIKETLRLHPPIVFLLPRETVASVNLGGFDIPDKTRVIVNTWAIQRDPKVWERPNEFLPERFINNPVDFRGQDFELIPFGAGRRGCPGLSFGVAVTEYVIANLLYFFCWEFPHGATSGDLDMSEVYALTCNKKIPLRLVPVLYHQ